MILAQSLRQPTLIALSHVIEKHKKNYYDQLNKHNCTMLITSWLSYFSETILDANDYSQRLINFLIGKARLYDAVRGQLNARQEKVLERIFRQGLEGFKGGLSAENYIRITGTSTRDLQHLLKIGVLKKTGALKSTRYWLKLEA